MMVYRLFLFHLKLMVRNYLVVLVMVISILMVFGIVFVSSGGVSSPPAILEGKIGVYTGLPIPLSFRGVVMYTSTKKMIHDIKNMNLPIGVDIPHKTLYTSQIYASISTEVLSYMASAVENIIKGKGLYPYNDDVWWDPFAVDVGRYSKGLMLLYIFLMDFLVMYISLVGKSKLYKTEKLWHLVGISQFSLHLTLILLSFFSAFLITLPIVIYQPEVLKIYPAVVFISLISAGVSVYFTQYASSIMMAYLAIFPTVGLLFLSLTYVLLPDKLGIAKYLPWTFVVYDIHKYAGAQGMIEGMDGVLRWIVYGGWAIIAFYMWYQGVKSDA